MKKIIFQKKGGSQKIRGSGEFVGRDCVYFSFPPPPRKSPQCNLSLTSNWLIDIPIFSLWACITWWSAVVPVGVGTTTADHQTTQVNFWNITGWQEGLRLVINLRSFENCKISLIFSRICCSTRRHVPTDVSSAHVSRLYTNTCMETVHTAQVTT